MGEAPADRHVNGPRVKPVISADAGSVTTATVALPAPRIAGPRGLTRVLESERLLAAMLLAPTVVLLSLFIAYPFVMGVWLSLSNTSVGNPGHFVGLANFAK